MPTKKNPETTVNTTTTVNEIAEKTASKSKGKKETVEKKVKAAAAKADKTVETIADKAKETAEVIADKAEVTVEKTIEKVEKAVAKKPAAKKSSSVAKKTTVKKSVDVFVQYEGKELKADELVEKAKADYASAGNKKTDAKDVKIYVKPEENMVYYVINEKFEGSFEV